jgi:hypothetical protein
VSAEGQPHCGCGRQVAGVARRASGSSSSKVGCEVGLDVLNQDLSSEVGCKIFRAVSKY